MKAAHERLGGVGGWLCRVFFFPLTENEEVNGEAVSGPVSVFCRSESIRIPDLEFAYSPVQAVELLKRVSLICFQERSRDTGSGPNKAANPENGNPAQKRTSSIRGFRFGHGDDIWLRRDLPRGPTRGQFEDETIFFAGQSAPPPAFADTRRPPLRFLARNPDGIHELSDDPRNPPEIRAGRIEQERIGLL